MVLHGVAACCYSVCVMHVDATKLATQRSVSPVHVTTAPSTITKSAFATKPALAPKPSDDSQNSVICDTSVRQTDVG